ncbi:MAG: glutamate synthase central domain-containing protein [Hydrogenothermaceae bacterium]
MGKQYYPDRDTIKLQAEILKSKILLEEDKLLPSLDGKFTPYRYFKHNVSIEPLDSFSYKSVILYPEFEPIKEKARVVPYTVPIERSFAIVELQDLTSEKRITNLLYDAIYEGIPISDLKIGLEIVTLRMLEAVKEGFRDIVLTDRDVLPSRVSMPLPFVLAFAESFLKESGIDLKDISIFIETSEVINPFEIATLLSLGSKGVHIRDIDEELVDILNRYVFDLVRKKGYSDVPEFVGSKNVNVVGLKNDFLSLINADLRSSFEVEGLPEIESYLFSQK